MALELVGYASTLERPRVAVWRDTYGRHYVTDVNAPRDGTTGVPLGCRPAPSAVHFAALGDSEDRNRVGWTDPIP